MDVSTKRQRIAELAKQFVQRSFTSLHHHLDLDWLAEAYRCRNPKSAPGTDAERVWQVLPRRFGKYGLHVHPEKTRLVDFRSPAQGGTGGSLTFLGFTHYWGRSRRGHFVVQRKTAQNRFTRAVRSIRQWCRMHRHLPVAVQHAQLTLKLRGHYLYYGLTGNLASLRRFQERVTRCWQYWLNRCTRGRRLNWHRVVTRILQNYPLPVPRIYHRYGAARP